MTLFRTTAALLVVAATAAPARDAPAPIDPAAAYVLVDVEKVDSPMMKGARTPGTLTLARYDAVAQDVRDPAAGAPVRIVLDARPIAKSRTGRQYLVPVAPDTWVVEGASGTAFSLGSMSFTVRPGEVVDLGVMTPAIDWVEGEGPRGLGGLVLGAALFGRTKPKELRPVRVTWRPRGATDLPAPATLQARTITAVSFTPDQKFGNHLGGLVNRFGGRAARPGAASPAGQ